MRFFKNDNRRDSKEASKIFLANYPGKSQFSEAFRTLRTNIIFSFMEKGGGTLLVTSSGEIEGKTTIASNLSYCLAQTGKTTLMIDMDLRKPSLNFLQSSNDSPGLSGLLTYVFETEIKEGSLAKYSVSDLYRLLSLQKKTGTLYLTDSTDVVILTFIQGELRDINWVTRPEEKRLASILLKNEILKEEEIKHALARHRASGHRLGFILIRMGLLNKDELKGILNNQMMEGMRTAFQFKNGTFGFKETENADLDDSSFVMGDIKQIYNQLIIGKEEFQFIYERINSVIQKTAEKNLFLLPSGKILPNPAELLGSGKMPFLISILKKKFDFIVIDSPPILLVSDALIIAPMMDGVLFVTRAGLINKEIIKRVLDQLRNVNANVLGIALNQVDTDRDGYYKPYYNYYSKYYGE